MIAGHLRGIVTRPAAGPPPHPLLILLNAGAVRRIGPNRLYVALARRVAAGGALVLRVDLSGLATARRDPGRPERVVYTETFLADTEG